MGCAAKLFYAGLTGLIAYQAFYNWGGAHELGGKYTELEHLLYSVFSLLPAIYLGIHAFKLAGAKDAEAKKHLVHNHLAKLSAFLYIAILLGMLGFRVFIHVQHRQQIGKEHIASYEKSRKFLIYYWGVLQYGLAIALSCSYLHRVHKVKKELK